MKLEQQVASLELCKRLKELGVKQESLFYWCERADSGAYDLRPHKNVWGVEIDLGHGYCDEISAFTVAELGEIIPKKIDGQYSVNYDFDSHGNAFCAYFDDGGIYWEKVGCIYGDTEADAREKMLIYLLENKLITL